MRHAARRPPDARPTPSRTLTTLIPSSRAPLSRRYGLTVLEALACGTPAVLPRCAVFDELWAEKLPGDWRYEAHGEEPKRAVAIAEALACASCEKARVRMASNPVKASWADATNELLSQYEAAIEGNLPYRQELATITKIVNQARARPAPPHVSTPPSSPHIPHLTPHLSPGR